MVATLDEAATLDQAAERVAALLRGAGAELADATLASLEFEPRIALRPLARRPAPADVWAVDGGQAVVADARCFSVVVTRAARVRFRAGACVVEEEGPLRATVLGTAGDRAAALVALGLGDLAPDTPVDVNLLRDRGEWEAVARCVEEADAGALVLLDGDLLPDWRVPPAFLAGLLERAAGRGVTLAGVTKQSSLSRGGAPLLGQLELEAAEALGARACWWAPVARSRPHPGAAQAGVVGAIQVVAARLDPDARFAFRVDLPAGADPEAALAGLSALCDDAGFPGYPYPLTVADRLAACPGWVRQEAALHLDERLAAAGVALEVRERAFADRHRLMERS